MAADEGVLVVEFVSDGEVATRRFARRLAERLRPGDVVALDGPLGAGKTCFVRGLAEGLGVDPRAVSSPTYVIAQEYAAAGADERGAGAPAPAVLVHLDGYRLAVPDELDEIGWDELLASQEAVVAVEWASRLGGRLPAGSVDVEIEHLGPEMRGITVRTAPAVAERLGALTVLEPRTMTCPVCRKSLASDADTAPFCSSRCRMVDLGRWFSGSYRFERDMTADDWDD